MEPTYPLHPMCAAWPRLSEAQLDELALDIAAHGLRNPIVMTPDGLILDGHNRDLACQIAGVELRTVVYDGDDYRAYVISANKHRRHIGKSPLTAVMAELMTLRNGHNQYSKGGCNPKLHPEVKSSADLAAEAGVHEVSIRTAKSVMDKAPHLHEMVKQDLISGSAATYALRALTEGIVKSITTAEEAEAAAKEMRKRPPKNGKKKGRKGRKTGIARPTISGTPFLTQEEVNPNFKGTRVEFVDRYGHVQVTTAKQRSAANLHAWATNMRALAMAAEKLPDWPKIKEHWLETLDEPNMRHVAKLTEALDYLKPKIADAERILARAVAIAKQSA